MSENAAEKADPLARGGSLSTFGRYRIAFELASGGMAKLYLARAQGPAGFEKLVALKCMHPHLANEQDYIEMFLDEARIASRISHPAVCSVFDFGEVDGQYFIAMEYIHGVTLGQIQRYLASHPEALQSPRWPWMAARIIAEAAEGLHAAHELRDETGRRLDVIHRDVSPQNLFVAYDGTVRVVDFGVARAEGRLHQTQSGSVKGKLAYLAPEQLRRTALDRRVDIWALGVVLWELLVGTRLFRRDSPAEVVAAVLVDPIPKPSSVRQGSPPELDEVVLRALARDPEARYPDARRLAQDLSRLGARLPEPVTAQDLADWTCAHFAEEKAKRERQIAESRQAAYAAGPKPEAGESSDSEVRSGMLATARGKSWRKTAEIGTTPVPGSEPRQEPQSGPQEAVTQAGIAAVPGPADVGAAPAREEPAATQADSSGASPSLVQSPIPARRRNPWVAHGAVVGGAAALATVLALFLPSGSTPSPTGRAPTASSEAGPSAVQGVTVEARPPSVESSPAGPAPQEQVAEDAQALPDDSTVRGTSASHQGRASPEPPNRSTRRATKQSIGPTKAAAAVARGVGQVTVATPGGWADVVVGGRVLGRAPGIISVPAGRQVLELRPFGQGPARRVPVTVEPNETVRIVVPLTR